MCGEVLPASSTQAAIGADSARLEDLLVNLAAARSPQWTIRANGVNWRIADIGHLPWFERPCETMN